MVEKRKQQAIVAARTTIKFKQDLEKLADEKGMTLPDLVRYVLMQYLENERKSKNK